MIDTDDVVSSGCGTLRSRILGVCFTPIRYDIPQGQESKMQASIRISLLLAVTVLLALGQDLHAQTPPARTALDDYIARPDASYGWKVVSERLENGLKLVTVDLTSQTWRTAEEVNRTEWKHWLTVAIPGKLESDIGFLMIGSGSNRRNRVPDGPSRMIQDLARQTGTVVAELAMVPNQPLVFHGDGDRRSEDDLIGYTWDQFLKTGDPTWPAQLPMAKSAVRAMDTITALMASKVGGERTVDRFVLAGASKRGWTTWLAGLDDRVVAIVPIVIDVLNTKPSMLHHFAAYGFWSPAVGNYVQHRIMQRMSDPKGDDLFGLVDPYNYRHRLAKPKYIVNAAGDQFFVLDSSQFYYGDLEGEKHLRYVPNAGHSLRNTDAIPGILGYYQSVLAGQDRPEMKWVLSPDGTITVMTDQEPSQVLLWQATNPDARDFRLDSIGPAFKSTPLQAEKGGRYVGKLDVPEKGWTAGFIELTYKGAGTGTMKFTTEVNVVPRTLPFDEKAGDQETWVTVTCDVPNDQAAAQLETMAWPLADSRPGISEFSIHRNGRRFLFHWKPDLDALDDAVGLMQILKQQGCENVQVQLESGTEITRMPKGMKQIERDNATPG